MCCGVVVKTTRFLKEESSGFEPRRNSVIKNFKTLS